ncbi:MAG: glycosyltransferase family 39 protein [Pseudomonadota bacterium]
MDTAFDRPKPTFSLIVLAAISALFAIAFLALAAVFFFGTDGAGICVFDVQDLVEHDSSEAVEAVARLSSAGPLPYDNAYCDSVLKRLLALTGIMALVGVLGWRNFRMQATDKDNKFTLRFDLIALAAMVITGAVIRLSLINVGLWRDESSSYFNSVLDGASAFWDRLIFSELNPPAYYLMLHEWMALFGDGDTAIKMPSLIFGVLMIPSVYFLGRAVGSPSAGLIAAAFATVSHEVIYYSQEARPYTLSGVLAIWSTIFAINSFQAERKLPHLLGFVLAGTVLCYAHYSGLVFLGVLFLWTMFLIWRGAVKDQFWLQIAAYFAIFVLYLPWLPIFFQHLQTGTPWTPETSWLDLPKLFAINLSFAILWDAEPLPRVILDALLLAALALSAFRFIRWDMRRTEPECPSEAHVLLLGGTFFVAVTIFTVMAYSGRYLFPFLPLLQVFLAIWLIRAVGAVQSLMKFQAGPVALTLAMAWMGANSLDYATQDSWDKSGTRELLAKIAESDTQDDTLFVISPDIVSPTFGYYARNTELDYIGFARFDDPEIFSPSGYTELWNDPDGIDQLVRMVAEFQEAGKERLVLVRSQCGTPLEDEGLLPYSRAYEAASLLADTFPEIGRQSFPGFLECIEATEHCFSECSDSIFTGGRGVSMRDQ